MNLDELRLEIDKIDDQLIKLFQERMEVSAKIAEYKRENNLPVLDPKREREKISSEIESILDLISTKSMQLDQYDLIIERQNGVIVEMKNILQTVSKI